MPAILTATSQTLSKKPRYRWKKEFVEDDLYRETLVIFNDDPNPFPSQDLRVTTQWRFIAGASQQRSFTLRRHVIPPGGRLSIEEVKHRVLLAGPAHIYLSYDPPNPDHFWDEQGRQIQQNTQAFAYFRGVSLMELYTLAVLYLATIAAFLAASGLILAVVLGLLA